MAKLTKNQKVAVAKLEKNKLYTVEEACALVKETSTTKFDASVDIAVRLGVDPRKANQMVRGVVSLPNGTGKSVRVLALVTPDKEAEATEAGADYVGLDEYLDKIKGGWADVDVIITVPAVFFSLFTWGITVVYDGQELGTVATASAADTAVSEVEQEVAVLYLFMILPILLLSGLQMV